MLGRAFRRDALSYRAGDVVGGKYRITGALGRGGFGAVYAGEHTLTRQHLAIKMLSPPEGGQSFDILRQRFFREAQVTASLSDPHTVRVFDVGEADAGPLYLVMELLRGPTLEQVLRKLSKLGMAMPTEEAIDVAVQILQSLAEAHDAGLVHRDLKPANIVLARVGAGERIVKVLDFGIARVEDSDLTGTGNLIGTPHFMSPEQWRGSKVDARSDLYALGIILFACVTGTMPFDGRTPVQLYAAHSTQLPPDPQMLCRGALPPGLSKLILACLEKRPEDRPADARQLRRQLETIAVDSDEAVPTQRWHAGVRTDAGKRAGPGAARFATDDEELDTTLMLDGPPRGALTGTAEATRLVGIDGGRSIALDASDLQSIEMVAVEVWDETAFDRRVHGSADGFAALAETPPGFSAWMEVSALSETPLASAQVQDGRRARFWVGIVLGIAAGLGLLAIAIALGVLPNPMGAGDAPAPAAGRTGP